jgi:hypothetical protein
VKVLYGLLVLAGIAFAASMPIGSEAVRVQIAEGPVLPPGDQYDPVDAGERTPPGFRQLLPRDAILPVYNPTFRSAPTTEWPDDILVIGVELDGEAKAYPVSFLNRREMVIDWIGGAPILVSW